MVFSLMCVFDVVEQCFIRLDTHKHAAGSVGVHENRCHDSDKSAVEPDVRKNC